MNALELLKPSQEKTVLCIDDFANISEKEVSVFQNYRVWTFSEQSDELADLQASGWKIESFLEDEDLECIVIVTPDSYGLWYRKLTPYSRRNVCVVPYRDLLDGKDDLRQLSDQELAWKAGHDVTNYVARNNLSGCYAEFGVYNGASFLKNLFSLNRWLTPPHFAFDSFAGLSPPQDSEKYYSGGDFQEGEYCCNRKSFEAILLLHGINLKDVEIVEGFYVDTLAVSNKSSATMKPKSISVCYVDCDLYEPTKLVLDYVSDLLEDGALICFDDWRLCRASPNVGERAAALEWLSENPSFELIPFPTKLWQSQWFIFQRRDETMLGMRTLNI